MNNEEKNIEENLNARFSHIAPNRNLFNKAVEQVTKEEDNRSIILKGSKPSPYQSNYTIFVKKITLIGLPIVALAALLVYINVGVTPKMEESPLAFTSEVNEVERNVENIPTPEANSNVEAPIIANADSTSVDGLVDALISESDADIALVINDTEDDAVINAELNNYNTVKSNTYENVL